MNSLPEVDKPVFACSLALLAGSMKQSGNGAKTRIAPRALVTA